MSEILTFDNEILSLNGEVITVDTSPVPPSPEVIYLTYFYSATKNVDNPVINRTGNTWNLRTAVKSRNNNITVSGTMPSSYSAVKYANLGKAITDILPVVNLNKFTVGFWAKSNTSGAVQFFVTRYHYNRSSLWLYTGDATNLLTFNFGLTSGNVESYNGAVLDGTNCFPSQGRKDTWNYWSIYVDRNSNFVEFYVNGALMFKIFGKENLLNGTQDLDTVMRFYPDSSSYSGYNIAELVIWNDKKVDVPTSPLSVI